MMGDARAQCAHSACRVDYGPQCGVHLRRQYVQVQLRTSWRTQSMCRRLQDVLTAYTRLRAFPLVDKHDSCILLGSITRRSLQKLLDAQVRRVLREQ
jgi:hypothetical protein